MKSTYNISKQDTIKLFQYFYKFITHKLFHLKDIISIIYDYSTYDPPPYIYFPISTTNLKEVPSKINSNTESAQDPSREFSIVKDTNLELKIFSYRDSNALNIGNNKVQEQEIYTGSQGVTGIKPIHGIVKNINSFNFICVCGSLKSDDCICDFFDLVFCDDISDPFVPEHLGMIGKTFNSSGRVSSEEFLVVWIHPSNLIYGVIVLGDFNICHHSRTMYLGRQHFDYEDKFRFDMSDSDRKNKINDNKTDYKNKINNKYAIYLMTTDKYKKTRYHSDVLFYGYVPSPENQKAIEEILSYSLLNKRNTNRQNIIKMDRLKMNKRIQVREYKIKHTEEEFVSKNYDDGLFGNLITYEEYKKINQEWLKENTITFEEVKRLIDLSEIKV